MTDEEKRAKRAAYQRAYYAANSEKLKAQQRAWNANNKDKTSDWHRKNKYGIGNEQYAAMLAAQNAACAICATTTPKGPGGFHVDHCHSSGAVRGLLCHHCNVGLGNFKDDTALLLSATNYINAARALQ